MYESRTMEEEDDEEVTPSVYCTKAGNEEESSCPHPVTFQVVLKKMVEFRHLDPFDKDGLPSSSVVDGKVLVDTSHKAVSFSSFPQTGLEMKRRLERELEVPVCVQSLFFGSTLIKDTQLLRRLRLRDMDQITLEFPSHARIGVIDDVLRLMVEIKTLLNLIWIYFSDLVLEKTLSSDVDSQVQMIVDPVTVESLVFLFSPASEPLPQTNRLYFIHNEGVELTVQLHSQLVDLPWDRLTIELQYLEHALLRILWDLSSTLGVRYLLLNFSVLEQASKSLLRVEIHPHKWVKPPQGQVAAGHASEETQRYILGETMYKAMGVMTK